MNKIVDKVIGNTTTTPIPLNKNNIIDVEYESSRHTIDFSVIRNICKYYDAKGNEIDFSDPQARDKLHTGIYRIKVKSTWEMPEYDDDLNLIGVTKSDSYSEEILVQNVYRYSTKYPDFSVWRNGETVVYQYLFSGNLTEKSLYRSSTIKLDGSTDVDYNWLSVLSRFEHTASKVSDISEYAGGDDDAEIDYPSVKALKGYAAPNIINTAEGSVINITDSANAKLKGLKIYGKTTQEGEPSIENLQPLVNVGDSGSVEINITDEINEIIQTFTLNTPNGLPGVPVSSGGNYTDENGQQYICDEIDLARDKYIKRVAISEINIQRCNIDSNNTNFLYAVIYPQNNDKIYKTNIGVLAEKAPSTTAIKLGCIRENAANLVIYGSAADDNLETMKQKYDGSKFMYILAEPIETDLDLTPEEIAQYKALTTHKPVTTIYNDADAHMKVDYVADPKNYIDNKFAKLQADILNAVE